MNSFKKSVVYQIYPKSFYDSNGDGFGDLNGIIKKLDYLQLLGIDYIWITPFYKSPQNDNGYDIADYYEIDERFGTMADFELLVKEAKKRGISLMLDMVFNHSSTEHSWFKKAISGDKRYKDFYIFKKGKDENTPPTNWISKFGGSAWEYVEEFDEYYLHLFDVTQGDLNWENPELRSEIYKVANFWLEKGVKGLRLDVINLISKPEIFEDDSLGDGRRFYTDGPKIHEYIKELNRNSFGKYKDVITVGEMSSTSIDNCIKYSNPVENELSMVFNFHHLKVDYKDGEKWSLMEFDFMLLKNIFDEWQCGMQKGDGWSALFLSNHDQPRAISRFGDDKKYRVESAKMLATMLHMMRGTPYIYQGEEIGMTNPYFETIDRYRDVESTNYYSILKEQGVDEREIIEILKQKSRDNSRTPIQWNSDKNSGFTTGTSWISLADNFEIINVENSLNDKNSIFYHYKKLISLRKKYDIISDGEFEMILKDNPKVFAYTRVYNNQLLLVLNNFYGENVEIELEDKYLDKEYEILISNYSIVKPLEKRLKLLPYESIVYLFKNL